MREKFGSFVEEKALVMTVSLDSTQMRLCESQGTARSMDIHARYVGARASDGERMSYFPELCKPTSAKASGILSTIPIEELFIDRFVARPGFKILLVYCDGTNSNLAALRMLCSELEVHKTLLVVPIICAAHALNNSVQWGLGDFAYGSSCKCSMLVSVENLLISPQLDLSSRMLTISIYSTSTHKGCVLRMCHVLDSVKHRNVSHLVKKFLRQEPSADAWIQSESFAEYVRAIDKEYFPVAQSLDDGGVISYRQPEDTTGMCSYVWKKFAPQII